jgi:hypothetical protein
LVVIVVRVAVVIMDGAFGVVIVQRRKAPS